MQKNGLPVLTWQKPKRTNGPISRYVIRYYDDSLSDKGIASSVNSETFSYTLPEVSAFIVLFVSHVTSTAVKFLLISAFLHEILVIKCSININSNVCLKVRQ